ncbi:MAG: pilus (MSHA type) biogenesis protein MshL [Zoogloeaceae bacterium]|jgi:general secretion pathway protein D|nr:pilus (MSHA type) biogenesis protein MshL [Zoogloeaceae bacterium]
MRHHHAETLTRPGLAVALLLALAACSNTPAAPPSSGHILAEPLAVSTGNAAIPPPERNTAALPKPKAVEAETYSVVVNNVRVQELLFALARDAKVNVDIHPGIDGTVTLNAVDQTLPQLLTRISRQVDMRWEMDGPNIAVMPDSPYLKIYKVDYVNLARETEAMVSVTTQVAATGAGAADTASAGGTAIGAGNNNSLTRIKNQGKHRFWETLEKNIKDILHETDKILPDGSSETTIEHTDQQTSSGIKEQASKGISITPSSRTATNSLGSGTTTVKRTTFREAASVITNPESGIVVIRATGRQHERIQEFLSQVLASARRQVLIEATIAEVTLSDNFQQGIDWKTAPLGDKGFTITQSGSTVTGTALANQIINIGFNNAASRLGSIAAAVKLLDEFGTVKVLSSPKLSVLNNQTAVLKVVDNLVYFTIKADTTTSNTSTNTTYTTTLNSVPVGLVLSVTPQIDESDTVLLNIRPSISRKYDEVEDPNPALKSSSLITAITSKIPVIRTREMESMIRVENGNIAVMGGLMEDSQENSDTAVPVISRIPILGNLFENRNDTRRKTELVIFLRPIIIKSASIDGDYAAYRSQLPRQDFFDGKIGPNSRFGHDGGEQ